MGQERLDLAKRPEEVVYRTVYAPVNLADMLATVEGRSRVRRLPAVQLYFGLKDLSDDEIDLLAPHVTGEQWRSIVDLEVWSRDRANTERFLNLQRHVLLAEEAVARKLVGAADPELWELAFARLLDVHTRVEDDLDSEPAEGEYYETPDNQYVLVLPHNPETARLLRGILTRLYQLDPEWTRLRLESARWRTRTDLVEEAYQNRTRRIEEMGFQDYFHAIEIYAPVLPGETPPLKEETAATVSTLPVPVASFPASLLLMQAFASLSRKEEVTHLLEELFFVCNKVLTADRVSPAESKLVKLGIRKALTGINLGLDLWSEGRLERAVAGIQQHFLHFFFRLGHTELIRLRDKARRASKLQTRRRSLFVEAWLQGVGRRYPLLTTRSRGSGRLRKHFFSTVEQVAAAEEHLRRLDR